jgi:hypothetical protein
MIAISSWVIFFANIISGHPDPSGGLGSKLGIFWVLVHFYHSSSEPQPI